MFGTLKKESFWCEPIIYLFVCYVQISGLLTRHNSMDWSKSSVNLYDKRFLLQALLTRSGLFMDDEQREW